MMYDTENKQLAEEVDQVVNRLNKLIWLAAERGLVVQVEQTDRVRMGSINPTPHLKVTIMKILNP